MTFKVQQWSTGRLSIYVLTALVFAMLSMRLALDLARTALTLVSWLTFYLVASSQQGISPDGISFAALASAMWDMALDAVIAMLFVIVLLLIRKIVAEWANRIDSIAPGAPARSGSWRRRGQFGASTWGGRLVKNGQRPAHVGPRTK